LALPLPAESECPVTVQQMLHTLWKRKLTILVCVVVAVAAALAYAKVATPSYQSSALVQTTTPSQTGTTTGSSFTLPDPVQELSSTGVQIAAAKALHDPSPQALAGQVSGTVDPTTGTMTITGTGSTPEQAQAVTKAFSEAYVAEVQRLAQAQVDKYTVALDGVNAKIATLQAQQQGVPNALTTAQISALTQTASTLQAAQSTIQIGMPYAVVQVAATPGTSTGLGTSKLVALGVIAGLLVGCGIAFVREQFDDRVRIAPTTGETLEGPVLGELPEDADVKKGKVSLALVEAPQSALAEAVRDLRTSLRVLLVDEQSPVLTVTSPEPGDGKTFVTANLAASWALTGSRVIVVSADFRRPRLEEAFGLDASGKPGLSDLITANWKTDTPDKGATGTARRPARSTAPRTARGSGDASVADHLLATEVDGLRLLPVGTLPDNPSELFDSPGMQPVLDHLRLLADIVLLDTPPVLASPDTAILGGLTRGALVVASEGRTANTDLERASKRLEATGCPVLGVVLNHVRHTTAGNYQAYAYRR
jgi:Mrp family chromosome partitioning ATPase/capsular polysaccharide biosynthesis protein